MKLNVENLGLKELSVSEAKEINGGAYMEPYWYDGDNPLIYAGVAIYNGICYLNNWLFN